MEQSDQQTKPDAEAIIQQIKDDIQASEQPIDPSVTKAAVQDNDLCALLSDINHCCTVGQGYKKGIKGLPYRLLLRFLIPLVAEINRFNSLNVRILNKLQKMLTGNDTATESDLLASVQRRIDLLTALGHRVDAYDQQDIVARLERIEADLADLKSRKET